MDENEKMNMENEDILKKYGLNDKNDIRRSGDAEESSNSKKSRNKRKDKKKKKVKKKIIIFFIIIALIAVFVTTGFAVINMFSSKIIKGIKIGNIDVSKMNINEAKDRLEKERIANYSKEITIECEGVAEVTTLDLLEVKYDINNTVQEAANYGRNGKLVKDNFDILEALAKGKEVEVQYTCNQEKLDMLYGSILSKIEGKVEEYSYCIEEDELIITKGKDGKTIDREDFDKKIKEVIENFGKADGTIHVKGAFKTADKIDIDKIYAEIHTEPKDAYIVEEPFQVFNSEDGVNFDVENAKTIIAEDKEEYVIPLNITKANVQILDLGDKLFGNRLGTYTTYYDPSNGNRSTNIYLAAKKINGTVVMPGETFSYNQTVGKRTIDAGFKEAGAYANGQVVQEVGGGICQVSSTLYNACLYANLEIVLRYNHLFECSYVDAGRDATVSWGGPDFKFKNSRKYPVKVAASGSGGTVTVSIYGLEEEEEYTVKVTSNKTSIIDYTVEYVDDPNIEEGKEVVEQSGHNGCTSEAYKILYKDGQEYSRTLLSKDRYSALKTIIRKGTKKVTPTPQPEENTNQNVPQEQENANTNTNTNTEPETNTTPEEPSTNTEAPSPDTNTTSNENTNSGEETNTEENNT